MSPIADQGEISQLATQYGQPKIREITLPADQYLFTTRNSRSRSRRGEVVMLIQRPNQSLLLHRKGWYERGVYRLPTGGIEKDEEIIDSLDRELKEETGYYQGERRFLGVLDCNLVFQSEATRFVSFLFYLTELEGSLRLPESQEDISDFRDIEIKHLPQVARNLRLVPPPRTGWGEWRALAHDFAHDLLIEHLGFPEPGTPAG